MVPNDYGLIRQPDYDLIAVLFNPLISLSEYDVEVVQPEYIDGYYIGGNTAIASQDYSYAITDVSKYEYVLLPSVNGGSLSNAIYTGLKNNNTVGTMYTRTTLYNVEPNATSSYALFKVGTLVWAFNTVLSDCKVPIIGFRRHRSDQVNPLGVIQPINPGILQPAVEDPDVQENELDVQDPEDEEQEES